MKGKNINTIKFLNFIVSLTGLILYYLLFIYADSLAYSNEVIFILSWVGVLLLIYIIVTWKIITGKFLTLYTLFIVFFFLFNYGQPLLWALGIHVDKEIGARNLYYYLSVPTDVHIIKTQLIVLLSGLMIHFGALLFKHQIIKNDEPYMSKIVSKISSKQKILFKFVLIISPIVFFSEFYSLTISFINAQEFGYTALYYNDNVNSANVVFLVISRLFVPVLIGLLIGSGYDRKVVKIVYLIFGLNIVLSLFIGDRGGWIYALCIFIICHHYYYKKIQLKQFVIVAITGVALAYISSAVVATRNKGISIDKFLTALSELEINPIIDSIFTMGGTMGVTTVLVMNGWDIFPYGNSFFYGLLIAPTEDIINILNLDYKSLGSWFSAEYLGISNGAGFSIVAETLINFGPYTLPLFMIIFGIFIYWITDIENRDINTETFRVMFCIITTIVTINISRNVFNYNVGEIFYTTLQFFVYLIIFRVLFTKRYKEEIKKNNKYGYSS